jgi:hypothetical protein
MLIIPRKIGNRNQAASSVGVGSARDLWVQKRLLHTSQLSQSELLLQPTIEYD